MFSNLTDKLELAFKKLRGMGKLSEKNIKDSMREVRQALLEADVNFKVAKRFVKSVTEKAVGTEVLKSIDPGQQIVKIVHDELVALLGGQAVPARSSRQNPHGLHDLRPSGFGQNHPDRQAGVVGQAQKRRRRW